MKKIIFTFFIALFAVAFTSELSAQNFVSTTAENKNVILEEFTGIYCQFCPDGHVVASGIASSNAGDVFLINIHEGGFATPTGGDPDFRTQWGTAIDGQSGLIGYPAGTVNRRNFAGLEQGNAGSTAMSRGDWAEAADTIMGHSSPVNVAAVASVDALSRVLTVVVETYYTANAAASTHKLNVALLQNNVEGPQTGAATYNPGNILPNGNYNHQHMLRHLLTGQWGVDVTTTTSGHFQADTFTYTLPADINGVGLDISNLEVVVFLAEGQQSIITGNGTGVTVNLPAGYSEADLSASSNATAPTGYCASTHTPSVEITNAGSTTVSSYDVSYSLNGGAPVTQSISTALMAGASNTVSFPQINVSGSFDIEYTVDLGSGNTNLLELSLGNNTSVEGPYSLLDGTFSFSGDFMEGFQNAAIGDETVANVLADNPNGIRAFVVNSGISTAVTWDLGGHGNSDGCFRWDFYAIQSGSSKLVFEEVDLTGKASANLSFSHAYAQYNNESDQLNVLASTDCGATWTTLFSKSGGDLATSSPVNPSRFYPQTNQWVTNTVDLSNYANETDLMIAFEGVSDYGNSLYVDDINVESFNVSTTDVAVVEDVKVFPNPATTNVNLRFSLEDNADLNINIMNALGQVVEVVNAGNLGAGQHDFSVNTTDFAAGVYFVNFSNGETTTTKRFVVTK